MNKKGACRMCSSHWEKWSITQHWNDYFKTVRGLCSVTLKWAHCWWWFWPSVSLSWAGNPESKWHLAGIHWQQMKRRFRCVHEKEILNPKNPECNWQLIHSSCFLFFFIAHLVFAFSLCHLTVNSTTVKLSTERVTIASLFLAYS